MKDTAAVILCGGNSTRYGKNKLLEIIDGVPVIIHTINAFWRCESIDTIVIVFSENKDIKNIFPENENLRITYGGKTRLESAFNGVQIADKSCSENVKFLAIHDGARPLIQPEDIENVIADARKYGASALGVPVKDTVKIAENGIIKSTLQRENLFAMQTPQVFNRKLYLAAMETAKSQNADFTDDCGLFESFSIVKPRITIGSYSNIKITTPEDLEIARKFYNEIKNRSGI